MHRALVPGCDDTGQDRRRTPPARTALRPFDGRRGARRLATRAREHGLLISSVEPNSPAERDGLLLGDVIVALNGEAVAEVEELQDRLTGDWVGRPLPIRVIRAGAPHELRVTVGERG